MLTDGYFDGLLGLVIENLVEVADELGGGLLVKMNWHYLVYLGQRTIDYGFVPFLDFTPDLHLLEILPWD